MTDFNEPNDFVTQTSDEFTGETLTKTDSNNSISLCHHSSPNGENIFFDLKFKQIGGQQPRLDCGELFILLNGNKRFSAKPIVDEPAYSKVIKSYDEIGNPYTYMEWYENMHYVITEENLRNMAYANSVKLKVTGATISKEIIESDNSISFLMMAKALYNAIFDNSLFVGDLEGEIKRIDDHEDMLIEKNKIRKEWDELHDLCRKENYDMWAFYGWKDCRFDTSVEEIIRKFGDDKSALYKQLNYCIPLYKKLHAHMHEFNTNFPNENICAAYYGEGNEEQIGQFINKLETVREQVNSSITIKRIIIIASIVVGVILLFVLFS